MALVREGRPDDLPDSRPHSRPDSRPNSRPKYRPDIDGLRAVAVLSVMLFHLQSAWLPGGFVGVDVFFVISGFVVSASLVAGRSDTLPSFVAEFYARRLARILPALVLVLIVTALAATLFIPAAWLSGLSEITARYAFFGLSNWVMQTNSDVYFAPRAEFNPYTHTWSLGVEEQFYLLTPFLVYLWVRALRRGQADGSRATIGGLSLLTAASLAACAWASSAHPTASFYFIGCRLWELAAGVLLYLVTSRGGAGRVGAHRVGSNLGGAAAWVGSICLVASFVYVDAQYFPWPGALLPVVATLLLIGGAQTSPLDPVRRALSTPLAVWIGKRSYSLYLWHWPIYVVMRWTVGVETPRLSLIAVALTFSLATLSYRWVEQPLRHSPWIEAWPRIVRIAGFVLLPICGFFVSTHLFEQRSQYSLSSVTRNATDWYANAQMPYPEYGDRKCSVGIEYHPVGGGFEQRYVPSACREEPSPRKVYVLGDSHAGAIAPVLDQLSAEQGMVVGIFTRPGCSYIDFMLPVASGAPGCLDFVRGVSSHVVATARPGDVVVLPSLRLRRYVDHWASNHVTDMLAVMYAPPAMPLRQAAFEDAGQWLEPFSGAELDVVFVAPTPIFKAPPFRCSDWFNRMNPICADGADGNGQPRAELEALRAPILESMNVLAKAFPNVRVWDPFPILCPEETCSPQRDGRPLFFDGDHLSAYGNRVLYPDFSRFLFGG